MAGEKAKFDTSHSQPIAVNETMTPFTQPVADEGSSGLAMGLTKLGVGAVEKSSFDKSKGEVEKVFRDISKLRDASNQNRISSGEARTRVSALVKKASTGMPWRAADFRKAASDYFGAYGEGWGDLDRDKVDTSADKLQLHYQKMMITKTGKPFNAITNGDAVSVAQQQALENNANAASNTQKMQGIDKDTVYNSIDTEMQPQITNMLFGLSKAFHSFQVSGKPIAEMLAEGMPVNGIIDKLSKNDTELNDLVTTIQAGLFNQTAAIRKAYHDKVGSNSKQHGLMFNSTETNARIEGILKEVSAVDLKLDTDNKKKALLQLVGNLETANKGRVEAFKGANMVYNFATQTGLLTKDTVSQYMLNPDLVKNRAMRTVIENGLKNLSASGMNRISTELLEVPESWDILKRTQPDAAMFHLGQVKDNFPTLLTQGYSGDERDQAMQKRFFASGSQIYLYNTDTGQPSTIAAFEKLFFDKDYIKLFQGLDKDQQNKLINPIKDKIQQSITNKEGTGLMTRIKNSIDSKLFSGAVGVRQNEEGQIEIDINRVTTDEFTEKPTIDVVPLSRTSEGKDLGTFNKYINLYYQLAPKGTDLELFKSSVVNMLNKQLGLQTEEAK